jgi:hypothetical protein
MGTLRNSAAGGGLKSSFASYPNTIECFGEISPKHTAVRLPVAKANILGSFIIKKLLNITIFPMAKSPNIFNVRRLPRPRAFFLAPPSKFFAS